MCSDQPLSRVQGPFREARNQRVECEKVPKGVINYGGWVDYRGRGGLGLRSGLVVMETHNSDIGSVAFWD